MRTLLLGWQLGYLGKDWGPSWAPKLAESTVGFEATFEPTGVDEMLWVSQFCPIPQLRNYLDLIVSLGTMKTRNIVMSKLALWLIHSVLSIM
jgi:hypothetical protein